MGTEVHLAQVNIGRIKEPFEGPTPFAFTFRNRFAPDEEVIAATDWSGFEPCPSVG